MEKKTWTVSDYIYNNITFFTNVQLQICATYSFGEQG